MDIGEHGTWSLTEPGSQVLRGKQSVRLRPETMSSSKKVRGASPDSSIQSPDDEPLLASLKKLRLSLAQSQGVPAYVIFADRTLIELAVKRPQNLDEMRHIHGIGQAKLDRFGQMFLDVIQVEG
jgi:ATP-dependent DNA helicase RecQ